jgi:hypothetical protein
MRSMILLSMLALSFSAFASSPTSGSTPFQSISGWYAAATPVKYKDAADSLYRGSCYSAFDQSVVHLNSVLVITHMDVGGNSGPAFPQTRERKVAIVEDTNSSVDDIISSVGDHWQTFETVLKDDTSALVYSQAGLYGDVKRYQNYMTSLMKLNSDVTCGAVNDLCKSVGEVIKSGTPLEACYYYQKMQ